MKKKIILGIMVVIVLGIGIFSVKFYKDYKDFQSLRNILDEGYIPALKETGKYLEEYSSFSNDLELSNWQVQEGLDTNLKLSREFEEAKLKVAQEDVKQENAKKLKKNVLETINIYQSVLQAAYDSEDIDDLTTQLDLLSFQIGEMNKILEEN